MGYYIRVLGLRDVPVRIEWLEEALRTADSKAEILADDDQRDDWFNIVVQHPGGPEIMMVERNPVREGELGMEERDEFIREVEHYKPATAVRWLKDYLPRVQVIYALQLLSGTDVNDGWEAVHPVQGRIWREVGGILQADAEGFSNEDGYHILWQFRDGVSSLYQMAVLGSDGKWIPFEMELGNSAHRAAFLEGRVPEGARLLDV